MITIQFVMVPLVKVRKYLRLRGVGWGGSEVHKVMSVGLPLLRENGGGGEDTYLGSLHLNRGIQCQ